MTLPAYEKLGAFYLGRIFDAARDGDMPDPSIAIKPRKSDITVSTPALTWVAT